MSFDTFDESTSTDGSATDSEPVTRSEIGPGSESPSDCPSEPQAEPQAESEHALDTLGSTQQREDVGHTFMLDGADGGQHHVGVIDPSQVHAHADLIARRYRELGHISGGGMGEIKRVWDARLSRLTAMKIIRGEKLLHARAVERFIREARTTGRLQHPGIVPVHDMGQLDDGRWWFTMQEVAGRTLEDLMSEVHKASSPAGWRPSRDGTSFRRLVDALLRVAQAVAYAHVEGYIHRDLKPENIMIGRFGEVMVLDWGLGKPVASMVEDFDLGDDLGEEGAPSTTRAGGVLGSPPYMAPEQARGDVTSVGPPADVYALGSTLYHLLSGRQPYRGRTAREIIERVKAAPPEPVARAALGRLPEPDPELAHICERAMAREPGDRYAHAGELARALEEWLDGTRRAEEARVEIERAQALTRELLAWRQRAEQLEREARVLASLLSPQAAEVDRAPLWALEDEADGLLRRADEAEAHVEARLMSAIALAPRVTAAQDILADHYRRRLEHAVESGSAGEATRFEALLRAQDRGRHSAWLDSGGRLSLQTEPPGAEVVLHRLVERERRLVPVRVQVLGHTPLQDVEVPRGRLLLELRHEGRVAARMPLLVRRGQVVDHVPPGARAVVVHPLPTAEELGSEFIYVPAGEAITGGDPLATDARPVARVWIDGFVISRAHVTVAEYLRFLQALADAGRRDELQRCGPCEGLLGAARPLWRLDERGRVVLLDSPASFEAFSRPDMPMSQLTWQAAMAYARWRASVDGLPWRLPHDLEWEKAARGVDGRIWPWGDWSVPGRACIGDAQQGPPRICPVGSFPADVGVYGMRHAAGNLRTWCGNPYAEAIPGSGERLRFEPQAWLKPAPFRVVRGGAAGTQPHTARLAARFGAPEDRPYPSVGIQLVRSVG